MKKLILITAILSSIFFMTNCSKEKFISEKELPLEIKAYIATHFPDAKITKIKKINGENELYEVTLSNGVRLEFDGQNKIVDIDGNAKLPDSVIPEKINIYVKANYPSNYIVGWEIQAGNQEVRLNNNIELIFTMESNFLRVAN